MLIDRSSFFDTLSIDHNKVGGVEQLNRYINTYERKYGIGLFGVENWAIIISKINFPDYKTFREFFTSPLSPIACYVFNYFQQDQVLKASGMGDVRSSTDNASLSSQTYRMRIAWNAMVDRNRQILDYVKCNREILFNDLNFRTIGCDRSFFQKQNDWGL